VNWTISAIAAAIAISSTSGCTVAQLKEDVNQSQNRIDEKQQVLQGEEVQQDALRREQQRLRRDIGSKQMSLDELHARLDRLQAENRRNAAVSQQQQEKKRRLDKELTDRKLEITQLQNSDLSVAEKNRRIEALKRKIQQELDLGLH